MRMRGHKTCVPYEQKCLFISGAAVLGEASETMVELCLWPSIVLLRKLAIWNLVFTGSYDNIGIVLHTGFYVRVL